MKKDNVEQIIKELAREKFNAYSEDYLLFDEEGKVADESVLTAQGVADGYYDNRQETEVERDEELGITRIDYQEWVMGTFEAWIQEQVN